MIPKTATAYCREDICLIENYELAVNDHTQVWHCHHRKETDEGLSRTQLIEMGLYYNRPASELIFLTEFEHHSLHMKGENNPNYHRCFSVEHRAKIGAAKAKTVYQIHKATGIIIREWKCINEAARVLNIPPSNIVFCCQGKLKSAGGFIWRYVDVH